MAEEQTQSEGAAEAEEGLPVPNVIQQAGLTKTTGQARDMMKQGAVRVDGEPVKDLKQRLAAGATYVCQAGKKRFARVTIK